MFARDKYDVLHVDLVRAQNAVKKVDERTSTIVSFFLERCETEKQFDSY